MRKQAICICENKGADQLRGNREADQRLCFRYTDSIVQSLYFLNPIFQASSHLLQLYSLVCVEPGQIPRRPVFSQRGSFGTSLSLLVEVQRNTDGDTPSNYVYDETVSLLCAKVIGMVWWCSWTMGIYNFSPQLNKSGAV